MHAEQVVKINIDVKSRQVWVKPCLTLLLVGETEAGTGADGCAFACTGS